MYMYVYMYQVLKPEIVCNILSVETATIYENILQYLYIYIYNLFRKSAM